MKRGQFEIMGLAIVVVIISMGVFFLISLSLSAEKSDPANQFFNEQFAQNTLDAFLKSTHPEPTCGRYDVKDFYTFSVTGSGPAECRSDETLAELSEDLETAITEYQGVDFLFEVRKDVCETAAGGNSCARHVEVGECDPTSGVGRPGRQTIPKYPQSGQIEIVLWLCQP